MSNPVNPVTELMGELGAGRVTVDEAVARLPGLLVPMVVRKPATTVEGLYRRVDANELPPESPPGSWQDVRDAYIVHGTISEGQYYELLERVPRPDAAVHE